MLTNTLTLFKKNILLLFILSVSESGYADNLCHGKFANPILDVCWSCLFPISIGSATVFSGAQPDTSQIHPFLFVLALWYQQECALVLA